MNARSNFSGRRIAEAISKDIEAGRFKPGEKLPTEKEMEAKYGAGRAAVRSALKLLRAQGRVQTLQGVGTFVAGTGEKAEPLPASKQLVADIRHAIATGQLKPGDQLPTDDELREKYGVSVPLIRASLRRLREEGLIYSKYASRCPRGRPTSQVAPR